MEVIRKIERMPNQQHANTAGVRRVLATRSDVASMPYELRMNGRPTGRFETPNEAERQARALIRQNADNVVEIIDLANGQPYAPAASGEDRDALARKIGF
jgi:hypothetical protein